MHPQSTKPNDPATNLAFVFQRSGLYSIFGMKRFVFCLALVAVVMGAVFCAGMKGVQPAAKSIEGTALACTLDSIVNAAVAVQDIPGAVLCIVEGDQVIYEKAYGYRQVYPTPEPMTTNTIFDLASLSKVVGTGMTAMSLVEEGLLDLDATVSTYLPEYEGDATIRDLMTHVSGLPAYAQWKSLLGEFKSSKVQEFKGGDMTQRQTESEEKNLRTFEPLNLSNPAILRRHVCHCPRLSEPRTEFRYSCLNFITLQYVMETITGKPLNQLAEERVFAPLGMTHTAYSPLLEDGHWTMENDPDIAPTELQPDSTCLRGIVHDPLARIMNCGVSGNAGVFSSADDLARLAIWMLAGEKKGIRAPFSRQTLELMVTIPEGYEAFGRALAWDVDSDYSGCKGDYASPQVVCHTGYTGTQMVVDLEKNIAIILLTHRVHPYDDGAVGPTRRAVADAVLGK